MLEKLTTVVSVGILSNMKAVELLRQRIAFSENLFAEWVLWQLPSALPTSTHRYKYRLAYVVHGVCVLRYDNESGKGDHRHFGRSETPYVFKAPEKLAADFQADIKRWNDENRNT